MRWAATVSSGRAGHQYRTDHSDLPYRPRGVFRPPETAAGARRGREILEDCPVASALWAEASGRGVLRRRGGEERLRLLKSGQALSSPEVLGIEGGGGAGQRRRIFQRPAPKQGE